MPTSETAWPTLKSAPAAGVVMVGTGGVLVPTWIDRVTGLENAKWLSRARRVAV